VVQYYLALRKGCAFGPRLRKGTPMTDKRSTVAVHVTKTGPDGDPVAELRVSDSISAAQLGAALQKVITSDQVYKAVGLKPCACKSGLNIHILGGFQEIMQFEV
jgi:hypothetical protein